MVVFIAEDQTPLVSVTVGPHGRLPGARGKGGLAALTGQHRAATRRLSGRYLDERLAFLIPRSSGIGPTHGGQHGLPVGDPGRVAPTFVEMLRSPL
jgi:hypothetical protein